MAEIYREEQADRLILLGDLLYHGARNELPEGYRPKGVAEILNGMKEELLCVRGNCDSEVDQMVLEFPVMADYALLAEGKHTLFLTHGHHWNTAVSYTHLDVYKRQRYGQPYQRKRPGGRQGSGRVQ